MAPYEYELLKQGKTPEVDDDNDEKAFKGKMPVKDEEHGRKQSLVVGILFALSICLNVFHYASSLPFLHVKSNQPVYFNLPRTKITKMVHDPRTLDDPIWTDDRHNIFTGMVALDDEFVRKNSLPQAQRYPWDKTKSLYYLNGYHSLHCLLVLRDVVMDARDGRNMTWGIEHVTHCLHNLREDIECFADDMPLYTGRFNGQEHNKVTNPGLGQTRICRDWEQLRQFAIENTACWNQELTIGTDKPVVESYKDCPDGSRPWEENE